MYSQSSCQVKAPAFSRLEMSIIVRSTLLLLFDSFVAIETVFCPQNPEKSRPGVGE